MATFITEVDVTIVRFCREHDICWEVQVEYDERYSEEEARKICEDNIYVKCEIKSIATEAAYQEECGYYYLEYLE